MNKNFKKRLYALVLACIMCIGLPTTVFAEETTEEPSTLSSVTVSPRAGTETWTPGNHYVGWMDLTSENISPVKTMSTSGNLYVYGYYHTIDGGSRAVLTTEVRRAYTKTVLASSYAVEGIEGQSTYYATGWTHVNAGDQIQIYTDISSVNPPSSGPYRQAFVEIWYYFEAD